MDKNPQREEIEFGELVDSLELSLSKHGTLYEQGVGDFLVKQDNYGNKSVGVILCKRMDEFTLIRIARECLAEVPAGWEVWFTYDQSLGDEPSFVVTRTTTRRVSDDD